MYCRSMQDSSKSSFCEETRKTRRMTAAMHASRLLFALTAISATAARPQPTFPKQYSCQRLYTQKNALYNATVHTDSTSQERAEVKPGDSKNVFFYANSTEYEVTATWVGAPRDPRSWICRGLLRAPLFFPSPIPENAHSVPPIPLPPSISLSLLFRRTSAQS
jgi:hypothetical protein